MDDGLYPLFVLATPETHMCFVSRGSRFPYSFHPWGPFCGSRRYNQSDFRFLKGPTLFLRAKWPYFSSFGETSMIYILLRRARWLLSWSMYLWEASRSSNRHINKVHTCSCMRDGHIVILFMFHFSFFVKLCR